jgi:hypothetical protein
MARGAQLTTTVLEIGRRRMNARITVAALAIASLSVGYAVGRSQWVGHAMAQAGGGRASFAA